MLRAGLVQEAVQIVRNLDYRSVRVFRQDEVDGQPTHAPIVGDQASGELGRVERNVLDSPELRIAERVRVFDQRLDDQIILQPLAMGVVGERVDSSGPGRAPRGRGQLLDCTERFTGEHRAFPGRNGDQRSIGRGVGRLQRVECKELRVVLVEQAAVVVRNPDERDTRRHHQHDQRREPGDQPSAVQDGGEIAVQPGGRHRLDL